MAQDVEKNRYGRPDTKRRGTKNPTRYGSVMQCTGCGSEEHFYRDCTSPNRVEYRANRLREISKMKANKQKKQLRTFYLQLEDDASDDNKSSCEDDDVKSTSSDDDEVDYRDIADEIEEKLDESMFLELDEIDSGSSDLYTECLNTQTRHVFFNDTKGNYGKPMKARKPKARSKLRYPSNYFPGIMIDNGSTGSLCSVSQLEAYRNFTGNEAPVRKLRDHYVVSAHGGSNCIGVATFKFPYQDAVIAFDAPIVENTDTPLILGLKDQDMFRSRGADQRNNTIAFFDGPDIPVIRESGHLWLRWDYSTECLYTKQELTKLHYRFGHPGIQRMHSFLKRVKPDEVNKDTMQMWVLVYLGAPDNLRHDQGTQFVSPRLQQMAAEAGITCRPVGIEAPNAMSVGERYHAPLRQTFLKLQMTYGMKPMSEEVELPKGPGRPKKSQLCV